jgi:hypothetical protein
MGSTMANQFEEVGEVKMALETAQAAAWGPYVMKTVVPSDDSEWPEECGDMGLGWTVDEFGNSGALPESQG